MAEENKHINQFGAEDIRRYHNGEMSPKEMHLLEKQALDDPFLADALEGYAFTTTPQADLNEIRTRLARKEPSARVVPFFNRTIFRAAAVFFILAGAGWMIFRLASLEPKKEVALRNDSIQEQRHPVTQEATYDSVNQNWSTALADSVSVPSDQNSNYLMPDTRLTQSIKEERRRDIDASQEATDSYKNNELYKDSVTGNISGMVSAEVAPSAAPLKKEQAYRNDVAMNRSSGPSQNLNFYNGRVVDLNNNAVPYVTIRAQNTNPVQSDSLGNFSLISPDTAVTATVNAPGFESNRFKLKESENNIVVMKPVVAEEVVVTGYGNKAAALRQKKQNIQIDSLEPEVGFEQYNDYVAGKLNKISAEKDKSDISGEVKLSFDVNRNGEPINIRVEKSLCEKCDAEAIRLLKEGPKWKKKKNRKGKITIRF